MPDTQTAIRFASAVSTAESPTAAVEQVIDALRDQLTAPVDLVAVFATPEHRDDLDLIRDRLREAFAPAALIGCSAAGVVGVQREFETGPALSVLAGTLPGATVHPFRCDQPEWHEALDSPAHLREIVQGPHASSHATEPAKAIIMLADPFSTPLIKLLPALDDAMPGAQWWAASPAAAKRSVRID